MTTTQTETVHGLFEEQVRRAPRAPAAVCGTERLSYGELDARANRLAHRLVELGVGPERPAAVALGRGPELLTAVLAVLKAGGAYVPLEPTGPDRMIRHVLTDADPVVVVTEEVYRVRLTDATDRPVLCLDTAAAELAGLPSTAPDVRARGVDVACVFYTSGSTGDPKGARIEHRNLLHAYRGWQEVYRLSESDRILQTATLEFDVFTADWLRALGTGATLVMARRNYTLDRTAELRELHELVIGERITVMETNVHLLRRLFEYLQPLGLELGSVRLLSVGAEKWYLDEQLRIQRYLGPGVRHINVYGVAEAAVDSTYFDPATLADPPEHAERVSLIGVPFPGNRVHLLDAEGEPVPPGEVGEICLSGPGVGRGYLNRPKLTADRFYADRRHPEVRLYRTGDLGRLRPDGILEFVGRDLGPETVAAAEVEAVLRGHPDVRECTVTAVPREPRPGPVLVAYAVPVAGRTLDPWALRSYLAARLPAGSVPEAVVPLFELPLTRAGKLDRAALPVPAAGVGSAGSPGSAGSVKAGRAGGAKGAGVWADSAPGPASWIAVTAVFALLSRLFTEPIWPGSTDVGLVPEPWALVFQLLYLGESIGFGLGVAVLFLGGRMLSRLGRPEGLTLLTRLALVWLLASWWPQDNAYRTTPRHDWAAQGMLAVVFNLALIVSAAVLVRFLAWRAPAHPKAL
ncbi:amino acid adenylation domain-containing protein [Kitasatospora sp. NPDC088346]|uniref:amino acid adenylation domain-containing protein n=1 Tax=Kitasatospora sp. NPDC088346 TaxID=3364073 RepID=UPI0038294847